jgi:hypothetical protein
MHISVHNNNRLSAQSGIAQLTAVVFFMLEQTDPPSLTCPIPQEEPSPASVREELLKMLAGH